MTKDELERIKQAYYSGLDIQIWFSGYWEDFDIRDYSMFPEPFSENRQYRIVGSAYADIAEKRIAELEAYNEKLLNGDIEKHNKIVELETELAKRAEQIEALNKDKDYFSDALDKQIEATYKVVEKLNKAKEIFQEYIRINLLPPIERNFDDEVKLFKQAEQFLKEE